MLTLYNYYRSSASYRVRIALQHKNIPHEHIEINLKEGEQHEVAYKTLNIQGRVPLLKTKGLLISQSGAILDYLEKQYPTPSLMAQDTKTQTQIREVCELIGCDIHPLNNLSALQYLEHAFNASQAQKTAWYHHWLQQGFQALETLLAKQGPQPFCFTPHLSLADVYLVPQVYNAKRFDFSLAAFPRIQAIYEHCLTLPSIQAASP